jgi:hypothetical protein
MFSGSSSLDLFVMDIELKWYIGIGYYAAAVAGILAIIGAAGQKD